MANRAILTCYFFSGGLGLIYEIIWMRKIGLIYGTTVFAMSTVLAAFFGGLALGSWLLGKKTQHMHNPIKLYAYLEAGIGIFALLFPILLIIFSKVYSLFYPAIYLHFRLLTLIRFFMLVLMLTVPTTMIGGTLPILSRYFISSTANLGLKIGFLYSLNTFGAAIGAFLCGFFLIPKLGVDTTNYLAGVGSLIIATVAYFLSSQSRPKALDAPHQSQNAQSISNLSNRLVLILAICFLVSGFVSIGYEVVWTRYLSLALANTVYTYTTILTLFLLGIAIGGILFVRFIDRSKNLFAWFGCFELGIGLSAFALGPLIYWGLIRFEYQTYISEFLLCAILMLLPTILMGATFPIILKIMTSDVLKVGIWTGRLYAINTLGSILGATASGFLILPLLGIKWSIWLLVFLNLGLGFICLIANPNPKKKWKLNLAVFIITIGALLTLQKTLTSKIQIPQDFLAQVKADEENIILVKEGLENTVWVTYSHRNGQKSLWANQTVLGRTLPNQPFKISPQELQGHIPMLLHSYLSGQAKKVLGICFGTGQTFGTILLYDIDRLDIIDISKTIIKVGSDYFKEANRNLARDPRVRFIVEDGRNFATHSRESYDLITLEPSPPSEAGIVNLYTEEFYNLCKRRLKKDGILSQWLPIYNTRPEETRRIVKTFILPFPNSLLWYNGADLLLLGFNGEVKIDAERLQIQRLMETPKINEALNVSYLGYTQYNLNKMEAFWGGLLMGPKQMREFSAHVLPYTDNHPDLEFSSMRDKKFADLSDQLRLENSDIIKVHLAPSDYFLSLGLPSDKVQKLKEIQIKYVDHLYAQAYCNIGIARAQQNKIDEAIALFNKALDYNRKYGIAYINLGAAYFAKGDFNKAITAYETAIWMKPDFAEAYHGLGSVYWGSGLANQAIAAWRRATEIEPNFSEALNNLGIAYALKGQYDEAIDAYQRSLKANPNYSDTYYNLGLVYEANQKWSAAAKAYQNAIKLDPNLSEARDRLLKVLSKIR